MRVSSRIALVACVALLCCSAFACLTPAQLGNNINQLLKGNPATARTSPGIYVQLRNETSHQWVDVYTMRHQDYHTPASNNKVLTTAAVITALGTHHVIKTPVYATGVSNSGSIASMCISGKGDPSMMPASLEKFANDLTAFGVTSIGQIILDDSYFQPSFPDGWEWGDLPYYYGAAPSSFILEENLIVAWVSPGAKVGEPCTVRLNNPADATKFSRFPTYLSTTGASGSPVTLDVSWKIGSNQYFFVGSLPIDAKPVRMVLSVIDTTDRFSYVLSYYLQTSGIQAATPIVGSCSALEKGTPYYTWASTPLGDMVNRTLQVSDNLMAEVWSRLLGAMAPGSGSAQSKGLVAVSNILSGLGVDADSFRQRDGSGLDCANLISPWALVNTVKAMGRGGYAAEYKSYLPNSKPGGGLYRRFANTPAVNRVFAKTGYISLVSSLSGWVDDNKLFSLMFDQSKTSDSVRVGIMDQIVVWIADLCPMH